MPAAHRPINNLERLQTQRALHPANPTYISQQPICTGLPALDYALGGGLARGQIYEVFGPESSGKTTLGLYLAGYIQAQGGMCAWIDADHSLDVAYATLCSVHPDNFLVSETQNLEQGFYILERLAISGAVDWLVLDSLTALPLEAELAGDFRDDYLHQRDDFLRQALPHLVKVLQRSRAAALFISQTRHRTGHIYQSDQVSTASLSLKLHCGTRFELVGTEGISDSNRIIGQAMQIRIVKHPSAQIFSTINVDIMYNRCINKNSVFRVAG